MIIWERVVAGVFIIFIVYGFVVVMITERDCLRRGYPKYAVTFDLERYCMNLDGSVTVRVVPQP